MYKQTIYTQTTLSTKKVTFNPIVNIYHVPLEERAGLWVSDRLHFQNRVRQLERLLAELK